MSRAARLAGYGAVSTALALHGDRALRELVDAGTPLGSGIGGKAVLVEVDGTPVFVKRIPLTDLERRPENVHSTANLFDLPVFCHYGVGGPGFGSWRELAAHTMTTNWVLTGEHEGFPLMYHWRVLPDSTPLPEELEDIERVVAYWGGGPQVRRRLEALRDASASVALFLEHFPSDLHRWLGTRVEAGGEAADRACAMVERELAAGISFMNDRGLLHFDAHFENILTDGRRLYFADYGLAVSTRFELSGTEADFYGRHRTYDRRYAHNHLVNWLVTALLGAWGEDRHALVHALAAGRPPTDVRPDIPPAAAAILARHAPPAAVMSDFLRALQRESRETPYPFHDDLVGAPGR
ncbi:protein kinase family protein [Streptomyces mayteni]